MVEVEIKPGLKRKLEDEDTAVDRNGTAVEHSTRQGHRKKRLRTLPLSQKQLQLHRVGGEYEIAKVPLPKLDDTGEVLIRVESIGLNPIDWKAA